MQNEYLNSSALFYTTCYSETSYYITFNIIEKILSKW